MRELLEKWAADGHEIAIQALDMPQSDEIMIEEDARDGVAFIYQPNGDFFVTIDEDDRTSCELEHERRAFVGGRILRTSNVALAVKTMIELNAILKNAKAEAKAVAK